LKRVTARIVSAENLNIWRIQVEADKPFSPCSQSPRLMLGDHVATRPFALEAISSYDELAWKTNWDH
jgi:hypothetical protein